MKTIHQLPLLILILIFTGCDETEPTDQPVVINTKSIDFGDCISTYKTTYASLPTLNLLGHDSAQLIVSAFNTEFCCGTNSISLDKTIADNKITIEIIDNGPFTYCFCKHNLNFSIGPLENEKYSLRFIESENSYSRDTFDICFTYSEDIDTTIHAGTSGEIIGNESFHYSETILGGCNYDDKSANETKEEEKDALIFYELSDSLRIFAGVNQTCCINFGTNSFFNKDTLIMKIETLNDDFCDCICYYTFDFYYQNYAGEGFFYQFYIDDYKRFEGKYNLPD